MLKKIALSLVSLLLLAVFTTFAGGLAQAQDMPPAAEKRVTVTFHAQPSVIMPGSPFWIAIRQQIAPGWHTYWKNPGDSGDVFKIQWTLPDGFEAGELLWPTPQRLPVGPLMNFGYEGEAVFLQKITAPAKLSGSPVTLAADMDWLVCQETCVPESGSASITLDVAKEGDTIPFRDSELFARARGMMPQADPWAAKFTWNGNDILLTVIPDAAVQDWMAKAGPDDLFFFPESWGLIRNAAPQAVTGLEQDGLHIALPRDTRSPDAVETLDGVLAFHAADGAWHSVTIRALKEAPATPEIPVPAMTTPAQPPTIVDTEIAPNAPLNLAGALLLAFLGGLILNLMPCVFPILSMKALSLVKLSHGDRARARLHGLSYTAGILASFALIAGTLIALQHAGTQIGWGFQLQNPAIVLGLAFLLFLLGLNLSGLFEIGMMLAGAGQSLTKRDGVAGSFFTGALATAVATPCTAPFMGAALGYALTQPPAAALAVFLALGFGLAFPYLLLCIVPALQKIMPRPGAWMITLRQALAFPMYLSAVWLVWVLGMQAGMHAVLIALATMTGFVFCIWLHQRRPQRETARHILKLAAAVLFAVLIVSSLATVKTQQQGQAETGTASTAAPLHFTPDVLEQALAGDNPVFVNMTAAWCITCKVNEKVALNTAETRSMFQDRNITYIKGDWTNRDAAITAYLADFGRNGVPLYIYYGPRDAATSERPAPVILPQLLTPSIVRDHFSSSKGD